MTKAEHIQIHKDLHKHFDRLLADWISETGNMLSDHSIMELVEWSHQQTINPSDKGGEKS